VREQYIKSIEQRAELLKNRYEKHKTEFQIYCETSDKDYHFETNAISSLTVMRELKHQIRELDRVLEMLKIEE
jgi:superfamily II helicase